MFCHLDSKIPLNFDSRRSEIGKIVALSRKREQRAPNNNPERNGEQPVFPLLLDVEARGTGSKVSIRSRRIEIEGDKPINGIDHLVLYCWQNRCLTVSTVDIADAMRFSIN